VVHQILLAIEDAYSCLLDVEDLDQVLASLGAASERCGVRQLALIRVIDRCYRYRTVHWLTRACSPDYLLGRRKAFADELFKVTPSLSLSLSRVCVCPVL
jgi:hypothetical protein